MQYNFYRYDWLDYSEIFKSLSKEKMNSRSYKANLDRSFFESLKFDSDSLKKYRVDAAINCYQTLGSKPALGMSGGVDSQCMVQAFIEAGIDIDIFTLRFNNDLNIHDVDDAIRYAEQNNIDIRFIDLDVIRFLNQENYQYGEEYKSASPHFNVHYKLCNILKDMGYTGVAFGGSAPLGEPNFEWGRNYGYNFINYINYTNISGFICQGNFLGYDPHLAWTITLLTEIQDAVLQTVGTYEERQKIEYERYIKKLVGYRNAGFTIIPQVQKFTGFELVKKYLEKQFKDGWAFEKLYRMPLEALHNSQLHTINDFVIELENETASIVRSIYLKNFASNLGSSSGI